jgi:hypothetical protein
MCLCVCLCVCCSKGWLLCTAPLRRSRPHAPRPAPTGSTLARSSVHGQYFSSPPYSSSVSPLSAQEQTAPIRFTQTVHEMSCMAQLWTGLRIGAVHISASAGGWTFENVRHFDELLFQVTQPTTRPSSCSLVLSAPRCLRSRSSSPSATSSRSSMRGKSIFIFSQPTDNDLIVASIVSSWLCSRGSVGMPQHERALLV